MDAKWAIELLKRGAGIAESEDGLIDAQKTGSVLMEIAALIERQERMIERACERLESGDCLFEDEPCAKNYIKVGCRGCARRWLEREAQHD